MHAAVLAKPVGAYDLGLPSGCLRGDHDQMTKSSLDVRPVRLERSIDHGFEIGSGLGNDFHSQFNEFGFGWASGRAPGLDRTRPQVGQPVPMRGHIKGPENL